MRSLHSLISFSDPFAVTSPTSRSTRSSRSTMAKSTSSTWPPSLTRSTLPSLLQKDVRLKRRTDRRLPLRTQVGHRSRHRRSRHRRSEEDSRRPWTAYGLASPLRSRPDQGGSLHPAPRCFDRRLAQAHRPPSRRSRLDHGRRWWRIGRLLRCHRRAWLRRRARQLRRILWRTDSGSDVRIRQNHSRLDDQGSAEP